VSINQKARRPIRETSLWRTYDRLRYTILFYVLLLTLLLMPIAVTLGLPAFLLKFMVAGSLFAAVMPNATKRTRQALFVGVLLLVLAQFAPQRGNLAVKPAYVLALIGVVGLAAAGGALRFAIAAKAVTSEALYAALSTYLLAGLFFGQIYWAIEVMYPASITGPDPLSELDAVYYSFVTLATLGYGDFLPRSAITRGIATFEVIGGQLYLAVLVARLIGIFAGDKPENSVVIPPPANPPRRRHRPL
jgi:hypothetical protein